jgi:hypothetical protein
MSSTSAIQPNTWLQQLPSSVRGALDSNSDGRIDTGEIVGFLEQLITAVKSQPGASYDARTGGAIVTKPTVPGPTSGASVVTPSGVTPPTGGWRDYVFGRSTSGNYAGVMVAPTRDVPAGYAAGPYRHQLEGFNAAKFDPAHPEGMTLKMIAARVFEQFDVYSPTAIDDVVQAFNELGIPATKVGIDQIDFGNGEGPIDVIRNAAWLDGDTSAGMAWQWAPVNDGAQPMNFTMLSPASPTPGGTPSPDSPAAPEPVTPPIESTPAAAAATGVGPAAALYPGAADQLDLATVEWLHANVSQWPVTSRITDVTIGADSISISHTKSGQWPTLDYNGVAVEGNPWVFVNRGGKWYAATYEWLRPGQTEKRVSARDIGANIKVEPLASWQPRPGEVVGFMVSTPARDGSRTSNERTNVVLTTWPA